MPGREISLETAGNIAGGCRPLSGSAAETLGHFARRLTRRIYLVLCVLMGFQLCLAWMGRLANGTPFTIASVEVFQGYLVCGVAALVLIRLLGARRRGQAAEAAVEPPMSA